MLHDFIVSLYGEAVYRALAIVFDLYPIWLPILLGVLFWEVWMRYIRYNFFISTPAVLLEVRLPREITRSPVAMEVALTGLYQTGGEGTFIDRYWLGKTRAWFSLELASFGGDVHFYVWTRTNMRNIVETQLYAQFPDIEIREVEDYARNVAFDPSVNNMWASNYLLEKPNPLPIRSYVDYGLHTNPKPENAVDPLTGILEFFGSIKPGEQIWLQIVIRAHRSEKRGGFLSKATDWSGEIIKLRQAFIAQSRAEGRPIPSTEEAKVLEALNRSLQKFAFDVGMRAIYIANKDAYNGGLPVFLRGGFVRNFSTQFGSDIAKANSDIDMPEGNVPSKSRQFAGFNSFTLNKNTDLNYPWEDFLGLRMQRWKHRQLSAYKRRMFFYPPHHEKTMVMTTETLATLWHFPGSYAATPGLVRIPSKRAQAPANLPT